MNIFIERTAAAFKWFTSISAERDHKDENLVRITSRLIFGTLKTPVLGAVLRIYDREEALEWRMLLVLGSH
jgi:hypothetical protein